MQSKDLVGQNGPRWQVPPSGNFKLVIAWLNSNGIWNVFIGQNKYQSPSKDGMQKSRQ